MKLYDNRVEKQWNRDYTIVNSLKEVLNKSAQTGNGGNQIDCFNENRITRENTLSR